MEITSEMLVHFLGKTDVFARFEPEEIESFAPNFEFITVEAEHTIFREGSNGDGWWVILGGEVSVTKAMPSGPPHVLSHLYPGDTFGEMALLDGSPRMASLYAVEESFLARLSRDVFLQLLRDQSMPAIKLLWAMSVVLCQRQRELTSVLSDLVEGPEDETVRDVEMLSQLLKSNVTWN